MVEEELGGNSGHRRVGWDDGAGNGLAYRPPVPKWSLVEIVALEERDPTHDRVELVFHLSCEPDPRWQDYFHFGTWGTVGRYGSSTMRKPEVIRNSIRAVVDPASRESTARQVRAHVEAANREFQGQVIDAQ